MEFILNNICHKTLNIAAICPLSNALGPGKRFVIWVQGCCFSCHNCGSPEWRPTIDAIQLNPNELATMILSSPDIEGITISGGEPILQVVGLVETLRLVKAKRSLSVICYTGFTLEALKERSDPVIDEFLATIDILVDGPYEDSLNDNKGWRGSSNQRVYFLSGLYQGLEDDFHNRRRDIEIHLLNKKYLLVGIKPTALPAGIEL
ncbi:MAG: 4Fe-4S single cluster domain-containing protein [Desulfuromonadaceae bacterium]|nr:4Fe-4S single cluster domain-containing protein [Desulfuromonadaceae bacterium]